MDAKQPRIDGKQANWYGTRWTYRRARHGNGRTESKTQSETVIISPELERQQMGTMEVYENISDFTEKALCAETYMIEDDDRSGTGCDIDMYRLDTSNVNGLGVFTKVDLAAHSILFQYPYDRIGRLPMRNGFDIYLGEDEGKDQYGIVRSAHYLAHYVNSSGVPNCSYVRVKTDEKITVVVVTLRPIAKDQELFCDYYDDVRGRKCTQRMSLVLRVLYPPPTTTNYKKRDRGKPLLTYMANGKQNYLNVRWVTKISRTQRAFAFTYELHPSTPEYFLLRQGDMGMGMWLVEMRNAPVESKDGTKHKPLLGMVPWKVKPMPHNDDDALEIAFAGWAKLGEGSELCFAESEHCDCGFSKKPVAQSPQPHVYKLEPAQTRLLELKKVAEKEVKIRKNLMKRKSRSKSPKKEVKVKSRSRSPEIYKSEEDWKEKTKKELNETITQFIKEVTESSNPAKMAKSLQEDLLETVSEAFDDYFN